MTSIAPPDGTPSRPLGHGTRPKTKVKGLFIIAVALLLLSAVAGLRAQVSALSDIGSSAMGGSTPPADIPIFRLSPLDLGGNPFKGFVFDDPGPPSASGNRPWNISGHYTHAGPGDVAFTVGLVGRRDYRFAPFMSDALTRQLATLPLESFAYGFVSATDSVECVRQRHKNAETIPRRSDAWRRRERLHAAESPGNIARLPVNSAPVSGSSGRHHRHVLILRKPPGPGEPLWTMTRNSQRLDAELLRWMMAIRDS